MQLRDQMRQMKEHVIRNLPELLEQLETNLTANGATVHWAKEGGDVNRILIDIARRANVKKVVKAKSMVTEEVHVNQALENAGVTVVETDLGEYIIQLAGEPPSHIIAPVIHRRIEDISAIFQRELDLPPTLDPQVICAAARTRLRREFLTADMGISGCNFAIAETGTCCIVTNEGNGRMTSSLPRVYVVVMGLEKLVPTVEDAFLQYQALCRSATGQQCSVYLSMTSGPRRPGDGEGPEEFHVILLDNGRVDMLARGYGEALCCIRCGACLNVCPVYREIGGHAYGSTYSGPIGAVISPSHPHEGDRRREAALCEHPVRRLSRRLPGADRPAAHVGGAAPRRDRGGGRPLRSRHHAGLRLYDAEPRPLRAGREDGRAWAATSGPA